MAPLVDQDGHLLVPGICSGALFFNGVRQFEATGRMQSFIMKLDTASRQTWIMRYFPDENFILTQITPLSKGRVLVAGIKSENINKLFEIDLNGSIDSATIREYTDPAKVYTSTVLVRGGNRYLSAIGVRHVSLRELDRNGAEDWALIEDTRSDLLAVRASIGVDYEKGLWISIPFNSGAKPFVFGRDTLTGGGLIDSYVTLFRGRKQHHSMHITGAGDQIVTGLFDSHSNGMSIALSHSGQFLIDSLSYTGSPGISLLEFCTSHPEKMNFSTFSVDNKERDRLTNTGIFFRHHAGRDAYLGGYVIKGESQTTDPVLTVGDESLVVRRPVFNSFLVRGRKKR